ncbi:MAG: VanZ family protein [Bacilli bacterium]|nr:VanZ family protein [Bacilli bacterium]
MVCFLISSGSGFFFAGLSEIIQLFTDGRAGTFTDVLIDFAGYLLYSIIVFLIFLLINYAYKKKRLKESIS